MVDYWIELATLENVLLALAPISRTVPTTITRITASITAYSAMSWPSSSDHILENKSFTLSPSFPVEARPKRKMTSTATPRFAPFSSYIARVSPFAQ